MTKLVKICGLKTEEAASRAIQSKADLLGVILVPNRARSINHDVARRISQLVKVDRKLSVSDVISEAQSNVSKHNDYFIRVSQLIMENGPYLVGVFRKQPIEEVFQIAADLNIDFIQLHGDEDLAEYCQYNTQHYQNKFGIIKRYVIPKDNALMTSTFQHLGDFSGFALPLLDSEAGGEGKTIDWSLIDELEGKFILAGGLNPDNLIETRQYANVIGYDVSGGVEDGNGEKNLDKIAAFVTNGKKL